MLGPWGSVFRFTNGALPRWKCMILGGNLSNWTLFYLKWELWAMFHNYERPYLPGRFLAALNHSNLAIKHNLKIILSRHLDTAQRWMATACSRFEDLLCDKWDLFRCAWTWSATLAYMFNVHETLVFGEATVLTINEISGYHLSEIWREASNPR